MSTDVIRFPVNGGQRIKNRRGKNSVSCYVSGRWLRFHEEVGTVEKASRVVAVDVMAADFDETPAKKICELVLELDDLRAILDRYDAKPVTS
ncbi:hypothetical protein QMZ05_02160 [Bradyrhizobium sp. INPA03-11B]|uniref:hypothetical protein n=1 Tax=Bradyrhizobium sp. INPA03-11B TaxID=418598 RepID=UPI00338E635C